MKKLLSNYYYKRNHYVSTLVDPYDRENWHGSLGVQYYVSLWQRLQMCFYLLLDGGFNYDYEDRKVKRLGNLP